MYWLINKLILIINCRYECNKVSFVGQSIYFWNISVSDQCCLHCDGSVFKDGAEMEPSAPRGECGAVETSVCRLNLDTNKAEVEHEFFYKDCCTDEEGFSNLGAKKNDPASCSEKVCYRTSSMYHALWHSQKVKHIFWDFFYGFDCRNSKENATAVKLMMK